MSWRDKAAKISKGPPDPVPKVTKPPSGTFGTHPDQHSQSFQGASPADRLTPAECAWFDGCAVACVNCCHFVSRDGPVGNCRRYRTETFAKPVFDCRGYWPTDRALVDLARRQHKVAEQLRSDPGLRHAFDVQDASPIGPACAPVSVVVGLRTVAGEIVVGELRVPTDRWDMAAFIEFWNAQGRPS